MSEDIRAHARHIPISPQKVRRVIDLVRGKDVLEAMDVLRFETSKATNPVSKVIASAVANAEENFGVSRDDLFIHRIFADTGPTRRWFIPHYRDPTGTGCVLKVYKEEITRSNYGSKSKSNRFSFES
jgi:large subunit ribosomal protein L22